MNQDRPSGTPGPWPYAGWWWRGLGAVQILAGLAALGTSLALMGLPSAGMGALFVILLAPLGGLIALGVGLLSRRRWAFFANLVALPFLVMGGIVLFGLLVNRSVLIVWLPPACAGVALLTAVCVLPSLRRWFGR